MNIANAHICVYIYSGNLFYQFSETPFERIVQLEYFCIKCMYVLFKMISIVFIYCIAQFIDGENIDGWHPDNVCYLWSY